MRLTRRTVGPVPSRSAFDAVGDPRVADLVLLARALAADNATALECCTRIPPSRD